MGKKIKCFACEKNEIEVSLFKITDGRELADFSGVKKYVCNECLNPIEEECRSKGIKGFKEMLEITSPVNFLKKYIETHPEALPKLKQLEAEIQSKKEETKQDFEKSKLELKKAFEKPKKPEKRIEKHEEQYTCSSCGEVWYINNFDHIKNIYNATTTVHTLSQVKDFSKCPKCGSGASTHKTIRYWVDKNGNCLDREE